MYVVYPTTALSTLYQRNLCVKFEEMYWKERTGITKENEKGEKGGRKNKKKKSKRVQVAGGVVQGIFVREFHPLLLVIPSI